MYREAKSLEIEDEESKEIFKRLKGISECIEKLSIKKSEYPINMGNDVKQVIWLCLTGSNELFNKKIYTNSKNNNNLVNNFENTKSNNEENKFLLFNKSPQIISFFKYLFAIKPKMQFRKLEDKFIILIECKSEQPFQERNFICKADVNQIYYLFDWLNFAGCRIPIGIYSEYSIDKILRMSIESNYDSCCFLNDNIDLDYFLNLKIDIVSPTNNPFRELSPNNRKISQNKSLIENSDIDNSKKSVSQKKYLKENINKEDLDNEDKNILLLNRQSNLKGKKNKNRKKIYNRKNNSNKNIRKNKNKIDSENKNRSDSDFISINSLENTSEN